MDSREIWIWNEKYCKARRALIFRTGILRCFGIIFRGKVKGKAEVRKSDREKLTLRQDVFGMNGERIREEESAAIKKTIMTIYLRGTGEEISGF